MLKKTVTIAVAAALGGMATSANASHFRGGVLLPSISASGLLTVQSTMFWRKTAADPVSLTVSGAHGAIMELSNTLDAADSRYDVRRQTFQTQMTGGAGNIDISWGSCCRVSGIANWPGSSSVSWTMDSRLVWDGQSANAPILFDFSAIQQEVLRGTAYHDNLGAVSGSALTLSYDQALNGIPSQPPGFTVDPVTGDLDIDAVSTNSYTDNLNNPGADYAFSGHINASDGSFVEFDWLFDGVGALSNNAPNVQDVVINALVGDNISHTMLATDDGLPNPPGGLTWDLLSFIGAGANLAPVFDPNTQLFTWDTTGSAVGTYIVNIRANDGSLTDSGSITINLTAGGGGGGGGNVSIPGTLVLLLAGLSGAGFARRRQSS